MVSVCHISACHDDYLCQIIYKSHHACQSYGSTQTGFTEAYAKCLKADCDCDFDLVTWFLFATHCFVIVITGAKLFSNPIMHDKVMNRTRTGFTEAYAQSLSSNCDLDL